MITTNFDHGLRECTTVKELYDTYRSARRRLLNPPQLNIVSLHGELELKPGDDVPAPLPDPDIDRIKEVVARFFHVTVKDLSGLDHRRRIVMPRHIAMYLSYLLTGASLTDIARAFKRHHTSVGHALEQIDNLRERDRKLVRTMQRLLARIIGRDN